jgi:hypothetical protein
MRNANIELQRMGEMSAGRNELSPDAAAEAILGLDGAEGVTMTVTPEGAGEHLMVAVDGSRAFLGLERSDGLLQFAVHGDSLDGVHAFSIGGQGAEIEERYLPEIRTAVAVVEEWLQLGKHRAKVTGNDSEQSEFMNRWEMSVWHQQESFRIGSLKRRPGLRVAGCRLPA